MPTPPPTGSPSPPPPVGSGSPPIAGGESTSSLASLLGIDELAIGETRELIAADGTRIASLTRTSDDTADIHDAEGGLVGRLADLKGEQPSVTYVDAATGLERTASDAELAALLQQSDEIARNAGTPP